LRTAVFLCDCGDIVSTKVDLDRLAAELGALDGVASVERVPFACASDGQEAIAASLQKNRPDRVVVAACSPREHEATFRKVLEASGMNPYLLQMANIREQVAWVVDDREQARQKALAYVRAAVRRAERHVPLERSEIPASGDALVLGAGPAGLAAALNLAEAGRKVVLLERSPFLGGLPVRFEEVAPELECGACLMAPLLTQVLANERIEVLTFANLTQLKGSVGNFIAVIEQRARHVDLRSCIGCAECIGPCPATVQNDFLFGVGRRKAMDFPFSGALPNAPFLDEKACVRSRGDDCHACQSACPVEGAIDLEATAQTLERAVGAVILATGARVLDAKADAGLCEPGARDVLSAREVEAMLLAQGPTSGQVRGASGQPPHRVAIVHCVGSLDPERCAHCSSVCCAEGFKLGELLAKKLPGVELTHLFKALNLSGKAGSGLWRKAQARAGTRLVPYRQMKVRGLEGGGAQVDWDGQAETFDLVVLCEALAGADGGAELAEIVDAPLDAGGFFEELHGRTAPVQSKLRGVYLAGACRAPADIAQASAEGLAASGHLLAELVPGRSLIVEPLHPAVDPERCAGCRSCIRACTHRAIDFLEAEGRARIDPALCRGCGTCAATCPSACIEAPQFSRAQLAAEIDEVLR
jgi:heterodisulfide reductase subunit A